MHDDLPPISAQLADAIARYPDHTAMRDERMALSYAQLGGFVARCQQQMDGHGAIGVFGAPSALFGALATACVIAGKPFVHLDPAMPDPVLQNVIEELGISLILIAQPPRHGQLPDHIATVDGASLIGARPVDVLATAKVEPDDPIYLVATSGTTGRPKCIPVTHDAALLSYVWRDVYTPYRPGMKVGIYIFAIWEMFRPLRNGAELCFPGLDDLMSPQALARFIDRHDIHEMLFTPSFLGKILQGVTPQLGATLPLRRIILNGEIVTPSLIAEARAKIPQARLWNLYSICETHDVSMSDVTDQRDTTDSALSTGVRVGRAMPHLRPIVLDDADRPCPPGQPGLLHFAGHRMLAPGYLNRPNETARRFRDVSIDGNITRLYDTGDRGYIEPDGNIVILGREAHMLKLRGHSIQISELTTTLSELIAFSHAIPWIKDIGDQGTALVLYYVADEEQAQINNLRWQMRGDSERISPLLARELRKVVPAYCIPSYLVRLDAIPLNEVSGKCEYRALPDIQPAPGDDIGAQSTLPSVAHAARILRCPIDQVDPAQSFHDLGGDSLMCVDLILALEQTYARSVDFDWALNLPLGRLHELLQAQTAEAGGAPDMSRRGILLSGVTGFLGQHVLAAALNRLPEDQVVYCLIRPRRRDPQERLESIIAASGLPAERVIPVIGSVDGMRFGLRDDDYAKLCQQVDLLIHCAATVNLAVEPAQMVAWTKTAMANVLRFCKDAGAELRFSSSSAVFPDQGGPHPEEPASPYPGISGYGAAKLAAEAEIASAGVTAAVVRLPSLYDLDAPNGKDIYESILSACVQSRSIPDGLTFPMTDVRAAAAFLANIKAREANTVSYLNLITDPVSPDLSIRGYDTLPADQWCAQASLPELLRNLIDQGPHVLSADARFDNANAQKAWRDAGLGPFSAISDSEELLLRRLYHHNEPAFT
ncbi:AMP-binding protein [Paracoccus albus]|uniref:AMP-binding protein n=1 Tax=Paracoccus albus TaxID=3017784 RepID=UPI0022F02192|nr:AMP-binding protein [Paracoccus albus]WBU61540.1 AMP-binding protein [Paracoccus albus]